VGSFSKTFQVFPLHNFSFSFLSFLYHSFSSSLGPALQKRVSILWITPHKLHPLHYPLILSFHSINIRSIQTFFFILFSSLLLLSFMLISLFSYFPFFTIPIHTFSFLLSFNSNSFFSISQSIYV
jgi:hypothetical protein